MADSATDLEQKIPVDEHISRLRTVISSVVATSKSIDDLLQSDDVASLGKGSPGISLLGLKADTMASYVHHLGLRSLFALSQVASDRLTDGKPADDEQDGELAMDSKVLDKAIRELLVHDRIILERGVRTLEKKIEYQIQKLLRATATTPAKKGKASDVDASDSEKSGADGGDAGSEIGEAASDDDDEEEKKKKEEEEEEEDDLPLSYKPRPNLLVADAPSQPSASGASSKKYVPPKINPTKLPSTKTLAGHTTTKQTNRMRRNQALEEYLQETTSTAPEAAPSVGTNVLGHGRGGTRTQRAQANEDRIRGYEESNFVRLQEDGKNKRKKPRQDEFMGENWDLGTGNYGAVKRKKKSIWDRNR
ncbi:hypothetical protein V1525DRAFT_399843 [Lipomyces kononenkoae]|uniref:Uncharacterized protein n=1 Tax=Lipomyces kononenkoae TaxID=34357 RepID=A0ACC3T4T7_LIPKO